MVYRSRSPAHEPPDHVDLDNLLATLTLGRAEKLRSLIPDAIGDQLRAAQRHAIAMIEAVDGMSAAEWVPRLGVDEWLRFGALDTVLRWHAGTAKTCLHMPDPWQPEPVWSAAWRPGVITCTSCTHLLKVPSDTVDKTCDCCGHICAGVDHNDPIYPVTVGSGRSCTWRAHAPTADLKREKPPHDRRLHHHPLG